VSNRPDYEPEFGSAQSASAREPIFNVPWIVIALILAFIAIAVYRNSLDSFDELVFTGVRGFIPARLSLALGLVTPQEIARQLAEAGGLERADIAYFHLITTDDAGTWTSLLTYAGLHGDWTHLTLNSLWFLAFGSAVARRLGAGLFLAFFALASIGAALVYGMIHPFTVVPVIGASGAVSGAMGAALLLPFAPMSDRRALEAMQHQPLMRLAEAVTNRRVVTITLVWFALNAALVFGIGAPPGEPATIAWEAHIAGYLIGMALLYLLDRFRPLPPPEVV